ncbi:Zinc finger CCCH domain-containing protein 27 [Ananas comosus]|uniref:Zinc finger CCCH domain-containing protein 27 n=1 Tax=Ananas comosus TaxID=4615 RepID=A0A199W3U7_ANACO|nr:Zinc finger CCCH domain-containing protein 27 [Ananas comosus]
MLEPSLSSAVDTVQLRSSLAKEEDNSTSSEPISNSEDNDISDDDDDDRNHKHRRREARPQSSDNEANDQPLKRPNKKRNRPLENGQLLSSGDSRGEIQKRRTGVTSSDLGPRTRINQSYRSDPIHRLDSSASMARGRGRGRNMVQWSQHDSRFNPLDSIDFAAQMASQGPPTHASMFVGPGLPGGASTQNGSWGAYGFIPGMSSRILDPIHPLGMQGAIQPTISPLLNLGMPRQRCRDFEERGFCLRGDMCPMEHGVNRIVVEDVQSLSQFNLPVSIPNPQALGIQAGPGSIVPSTAPSSLFTSSKAIVPTKDSKSIVADDALRPNGVSSASVVAEADVYDPDQPLWNNERPETSSLRLPSLNNDEEPTWDADGIGSDSRNRSSAAIVGSESTNSSVWGRIKSGNKSEPGRLTSTNVTAASYTENELKEDDEATPGTIQGKPLKPYSRLRGDQGRNSGRTTQRASRTLYINGIPQKSNRRETLFAHFRKFGNIIDIYIPANSEKAFVQFSKREEAEAALKAPDAVMGNRFIKLWWANRDRISDEGESKVNPKLMQLTNTAGPSMPPQQAVSDGGKEKENQPSVAPKASMGSASDTTLPTTGSSKSLLASGPKTTPPVQKKLESLELLDELRKKQEILAQKRNAFRRELDKLAKQVAVLKDHFSSFGELSSVVLEDAEAHNEGLIEKPSQRCSAVVTFTTRQSAERAYDGGKSWKGHNLQFMWLKATSNSNSSCGLQETSTPISSSGAHTLADLVISESPSSTKGKSVGVQNGEPVANVEGTNTVEVPTSSSEHPPECDVPMDADKSKS